MSSPDTASRSKATSSAASTTSQPRRRRGGPGGPVPTGTGGITTAAPPAPSNNLNIDMSGLRISDTASVVSTATIGTASSGRRRRRRRNNKLGLPSTPSGGGARLAPIPSNGGGNKKPAKLQIGLNLDVELELKAKLGGELTLSLVLEEKPKPRACPELRMPGEGEAVVTELFYMRVGTLRYSRRWLDPDAVLRGQVFLTALSAVVLVLAGVVMGWVAGRATAGREMPMVAYGNGDVYASGSGGLSAASSNSWPDGVVRLGRIWGCKCNSGLVDTGVTDLAIRSVANSSFL